jgi:tRNA nucleotidyltransferase (CCA-adding enzyme)
VSELAPKLIEVPPAVEGFLRACRASGGRGILVGGCVRDALLGLASADLDIEVHGVTPDQLRGLARSFGRVDEVGRAFGVLKVRVGGLQVDLSVPRRDSKVGVGHRGIHAETEPNLGVTEAARRRDLTVNAIGWDPLTSELLDPFNGRSDLAKRRLAAVDADTFSEDPLRALRVAQFAARFGFTAAPELVSQCRAMDVSGLPSERVRGEVEKLLVRGKEPARGWTFAYEAGLWRRLLPEWDAPAPADLDRLAAAPIEGDSRRLALLLACTAGPEALLAVLDRLRIFAWLGYDVRGQALALASVAAQPNDARPVATRARWLAETLEVELLATLTNDTGLLAAAEALGVSRAPLLPLLSGRDLLPLGHHPGPALGRLLKRLRAAQLDGQVSSPEAALEWARSRLR